MKNDATSATKVERAEQSRRAVSRTGRVKGERAPPIAPRIRSPGCALHLIDGTCNKGNVTRVGVSVAASRSSERQGRKDSGRSDPGTDMNLDAVEGPSS